MRMDQEIVKSQMSLIPSIKKEGYSGNGNIY